MNMLIRLISVTAFAVVTAIPGFASPAQGKPMDDLTAFTAGGWKVLESKVADLDNDGRPDMLLILDPPSSGTENAAQGTARRVLILTRSAEGQLQKSAVNDRLVPCATCGGAAGDPYGYAQATAGNFKIVVGGGSREHWSDEYTFLYSTEEKDWFVQHVLRRVDDTETGKHQEVNVEGVTLGHVRFSTFDPATLPEATLP